MADVELVIRIDESLYKEGFADGEKFLYVSGMRSGKTLLATLVRAVRNGKPCSECEHDHEILKAYSDGFSNAVDTIRAEIEKLEYLNIEDGSDGYDKYIDQYEVLKIINKYKTESEVEE